jgi:hypothetical protein
MVLIWNVKKRSKEFILTAKVDIRIKIVLINISTDYRRETSFSFVVLQIKQALKIQNQFSSNK